MAVKTQAPQTTSVEEKLRALFDLQLIDSTIDKIRAMRGELPVEVQELEQELESLQAKIDKTKAEIAEYDNEVKSRKITIKDSEALIKKYTTQLDNVRNNREYEALQKEIEFQGLEIQFSEKKIREFQIKIDHLKEILNDNTTRFDERSEDLRTKKSELDNILEETIKEEKLLMEKSKEFEVNIEERLRKAYKRIRSNVKNGLAVVPVQRGATGGSFFLIPSQTQVEIANRKKIIFSEHCGRILVDEDLANEETEKMNSLFKSLGI
jgi:predicted  nucleic acid-binding Zn-ribbon protein